MSFTYNIHTGLILFGVYHKCKEVNPHAQLFHGLVLAQRQLLGKVIKLSVMIGLLRKYTR